MGLGYSKPFYCTSLTIPLFCYNENIMKRTQILAGSIILIFLGILFIYGAYNASSIDTPFFYAFSKQAFFKDIKLYLGLVFMGVGIFLGIGVMNKKD